MIRFLAIYNDTSGNARVAMLSTTDELRLPFGVNEAALGLPDHDGNAIILVEMPTSDFRPEVVHTGSDEEMPLRFVDL